MKVKNLIQERTAHIRAFSPDSENRTYDFVISTEAPDSYGTVFRADGWEMDSYLLNPVVCWNHRSFSDDPDDIVGTSELIREGNIWIGRVTLEEGNPKADTLKRKIDNGTIRGASVGAMVKRGDWGDETKGEDPNILYFTRQELKEWSIVGVQSNPDAVKRNKEKLGTAFAKAEQQPANRNTAPLDEFEAVHMYNVNNS